LEKNHRIKQVLILQIRGASSYATGVYERGRICPLGFRYNDGSKSKSSRGWLYQAFAPLSTLLKVRDTGQLMRNDVEVNLLRDKWSERRDRVVSIYTTVFEFKGADPPLSWHLTADQTADIDANWLAEAGGCNDPESHPSADRSNAKYGGWPTVRTFLTLNDDDEQPKQVQEQRAGLPKRPRAPARAAYLADLPPRAVSPNKVVRAGRK
jgi:hypothetical protein